MEEEFRDIPGYEGLYQVSNLGRVKSLERICIFKQTYRHHKEFILKPTISNGYYIISLYKNGIKYTKPIHILVAISFYNHIPNRYKIVCDHINGDKLNNNINNLRLVTQRQNTTFYNEKNKLSSNYIGVSYDKTSKKYRSYIYINGKNKFLGYFNNELEASNAYQEALKNLQIGSDT